MLLKVLAICFTVVFFYYDVGLDFILGKELRELAFPDGALPRRAIGQMAHSAEPPVGVSLGNQISYSMLGSSDAMFGDDAPYYRGMHFFWTFFWIFFAGFAEAILVAVQLPKQDYMSIEWRIVIMIGSLFLLGPNLIYLYIICYHMFVEDEDIKTVTTARALQFASMTKMAHLAFESFPQFCTQLTMGSMNAFNEGYVDLSHLMRASIVGSAWAVSAGVANYLYERRGVMISPNCHSLSSAISICFFVLSELAVLGGFCRFAGFCGVCMTTYLVPVMVLTTLGMVGLMFLEGPEHDWSKRFCPFIAVKAMYWFIGFILEKQLTHYFPLYVDVYASLEEELLLNGSDQLLYWNLWIFVPINLTWGSLMFFSDNGWTAAYIDPIVKYVILPLLTFLAERMKMSSCSSIARVGRAFAKEMETLIEDIPIKWEDNTCETDVCSLKSVKISSSNAPSESGGGEKGAEGGGGSNVPSIVVSRAPSIEQVKMMPEEKSSHAAAAGAGAAAAGDEGEPNALAAKKDKKKAKEKTLHKSKEEKEDGERKKESEEGKEEGGKKEEGKEEEGATGGERENTQTGEEKKVVKREKKTKKDGSRDSKEVKEGEKDGKRLSKEVKEVPPIGETSTPKKGGAKKEKESNTKVDQQENENDKPVGTTSGGYGGGSGGYGNY